MRILRSISTIAILAAACAFGGCSSGQGTDQQANSGGHMHDRDKLGGKNKTAACIVTDFELQNEGRRLWTDHVAYTRFYIIEAIASQPGAPFTAERLLANQDQIGASIKPFYGPDAGMQLAQLLREHINGAVAVVKAAKAGDAAGLAAAKDAWYANADAIAKFLSDANPFLPFDQIDQMMRTHLDQLLAEATARLTGDWAGDVAAFDATVNHILMMSDAISAAITKQFPNLVSTKDSAVCCDAHPVSRMDLHLASRKLWEDHAIWTRVVILGSFGVCNTTLPDLPTALDRLLQNQVDLGNSIKPFYGEDAGNQLTALLKEHILDAAAAIKAAKSGDQAALDDAKAKLYANADAIATFLATANPNIDLASMKAMMRTHIDQLLSEVVNYMNANYPGSIGDYDATVLHLLNLSDTISNAITKQFPE
jgi:hypothetical protein